MTKSMMTAALLLLLGAALAPQDSLAQQPFRWVQDNIDLYNLEVLRVDGRRLTVRVSELQGRRTFRVPAGFNFYIEGEPTDVSGLRPRQKLRAYVTRTRTGELVLVDAGPPRDEPPATPPQPPVIAPQVPAESAMLPKTASPVPLSGLAGLFVLATAFGVRRFRLRK